MTKIRNAFLAALVLVGGFFVLTQTALLDDGNRAVKLIARWDTGKSAAISWSAGPDVGHMPTTGDAVGEGGYWQGTITVRRGDLVVFVVRPVSMAGTVTGWVLKWDELATDANGKIGRDGFVEIRKVIT